MIDACDPVTSIPRSVHCPFDATGYPAPTVSIFGSATTTASDSCASPMVATSTIDAWRGEQPADHRDLHERAVERADGQARDHREPERDAVVDDHDREQGGAHEAHVPDREVDDARRAVDQHDAHGKQPDDETGDEAVEDELLRDPGRDDHDG